ncbi:MAG: phosphoenolpyruvate synthase/pyruvate phosphate dikinase [Deltaproteobacteria bacterium]|nr:phosphoenolpyruvate synthase/pyruvate phosphate dikinase [Deltaproteobacteria bacterium]
MTLKNSELPNEFYSQFKMFHEIMSIKVREILLISSPYDAYIMEEDRSLASRIVNEYIGLNLSLPPRVTRTSSGRNALTLLEQKTFEMVITMPNVDDMDAQTLGVKIKAKHPDLPVILLSHSLRSIFPQGEYRKLMGIDKVFIWSGNSDLLLALVKNAEDRLNVDRDTQRAMVRVLILVEDSPQYYSSFLPLIYKEIVKQTQAVLGVGLNEEHRLLRMRSRPKIMLAETYEEAMNLFRKYRSYLIGIISDTRIPRNGKLDDHAGADILAFMKQEIPDLPILMLSSDPHNRMKADRIPAIFLDKNSPNLLIELQDFFLNHLGFGDFVFRLPDRTEIDRASSLRTLELKISRIPDESLLYHASRNHFSNWLMARSEFALASTFRKVQASEFQNTAELRQYIISGLHTVRKLQQKGVVAQFRAQTFDSDIMDFVKIGDGSLGGKARGLAFMSVLLLQHPALLIAYPQVSIQIPKTLVVTTQGFESFIALNHLQYCAKNDFSDQDISEIFLKAEMPEWLVSDLEAFLVQVHYPLSIRSSSLLEDAQFQPYAGLYKTYMIPNNHPDPTIRLRQLINAIKLVYASTYYEDPRSFARNSVSQPQEESMAVIIQQLTGEVYGDYFYPALSGVVQSHNFYPVSHMKSEDGIAHIAIGMGKTVVEGEKSVRFSPRYPRILPQFTTVEDILSNCQRYFYALKVRDYPDALNFDRYANLEKREVDEAQAEYPIRVLSSVYIPDEHRIRDSGHLPGSKIASFASILKHNLFPLPQLLSDLLDLGRKGMGCPVEIEFSVNLGTEDQRKNEFYFLQMRPMATEIDQQDVVITDDDLQKPLCFSRHALGNGKFGSISDIVYVKPLEFQINATEQMADEIGRINAMLSREKRPFLLIGPGRWGTADRWLGIPVQWRNISGVGAIIELKNSQIHADPSQGSHFFQNITSLGIPYITVAEDSDDTLDWKRVEAYSSVQETRYIRHVRLDHPVIIKIQGKKSIGVIYELNP